jgi:hypothetical protein
MAITKTELEEYIRDIISGGDESLEGKYHPTIVWKTADTVLGGLIAESLRKDRQVNGYEINGSYLSSAVLDVEEDTDRDEKYAVLPYPIVSLKENRGLHRVSETKNPDVAFSQIPNGGRDVFNALDVKDASDKVKFYQEGNKIYFRRIGNLVDKVLVKAVFSLTNADPDAPIAIPADMEDVFIDRILQRLGISQATPQDKSNDNNPNIPQ